MVHAFAADSRARTCFVRERGADAVMVRPAGRDSVCIIGRILRADNNLCPNALRSRSQTRLVAGPNRASQPLGVVENGCINGWCPEGGARRTGARAVRHNEARASSRNPWRTSAPRSGPKHVAATGAGRRTAVERLWGANPPFHIPCRAPHHPREQLDGRWTTFVRVIGAGRGVEQAVALPAEGTLLAGRHMRWFVLSAGPG